MNTLFRYIFSKAFMFWLAALLSLLLLVMLSMLFGNLAMFAEHDIEGSLAMRYMLYSVPQAIYWILPFSICLGVLIAQANFSRHVETIAMQACPAGFLGPIWPWE